MVRLRRGTVTGGLYDVGEEETTAAVEDYSLSARRKGIRMAAMAAAIVLTFAVTLVIGNVRYGYSAGEILSALLSHDTSNTIGRYIWNIDVPRMGAAIIAGAALSVAGVAMQCILRNPLASPYTLGLSNAAAFGAALSILFVTGDMVFRGPLGDFITPIIAFVLSLAATGIILFLTKVTRVSTETMVLAGIAVSAIFSAGMTAMQYMADQAQLSRIVSWTFGSLAYADYWWDGLMLVAFTLAFAYFYSGRWSMNAMEAGDDTARGLGVNTERFLTLGLVIASVVSAVVVSKFGIIAFVGLLGPHMARMLVGNDHRFLIPASALLGALLLLVANTVAYNVLYPTVLPVGLLTSLLGGPAFIFLLIRRFRQ